VATVSSQDGPIGAVAVLAVSPGMLSAVKCHPGVRQPYFHSSIGVLNEGAAREHAVAEPDFCVRRIWMSEWFFSTARAESL